jgi:hypothetical protein
MESALVIILAETREYAKTFDSFESNLMNVVNGDLALCVADNPREVKTNPFYKKAKYTWTYTEPEDWGDAFDWAQAQMGSNSNWRQLLNIKYQWLGGAKGPNQHMGSGGILLFFRWFLKHSLLQSDVLDKYDRFLVTRSDFIHETPHLPLSLLNSKYIWIPEGEDFGGFNDRHIVANKQDILSICSITDDILIRPDEVYSRLSPHQPINIEKYIRLSFEARDLSSKIRRYPYTMYSIRSESGHTRWAKGTLNEQLGYYIKYEFEFKRSANARKLLTICKHWSRTGIFLLRMINCISDFRETVLVPNVMKIGSNVKRKILRL